MAEYVRFEQFQEAIDAGRRTGAPTEFDGAQLVWRHPARLTPAERFRWDDLAGASQSQSPFCQPWFLIHALINCDPDGAVRLLVVEDSGGQWLGVLPVCHAQYHGRAPLPHWLGWRHPNQFAGTPLVRRGAGEVFWRTVLDGLAETTRGELALCLSEMPLDDAVVQALFAVCAHDGREAVIDRDFERAILRTDNPPVLRPKHRRRIEALQRRLASELGPPQFRFTRVPGEVERAVDEFLVLERSGWKGTNGSALACAFGTSALFAGVARDGADRGCFEMATLHTGGRLLAASSQLVGQGRRYGFKMAYDESAAAYAPGLLLLNWITGQLCSLGPGYSLDSCAAPDQEPVSRMWPDRTRLVDCRIALGGPLRRSALRLVMAGEAAYSRAKTLAKP